MSNDSGQWDGETLQRKGSLYNSLRGITPDGGRPREEPFRNFGGWKCQNCGSGNTVIEGYDSGPEGYCMTCTRYIPIPKENRLAYSRHSR
ncbi:hypothetical protein LCGC14_0364380 [marine sediment metagenome]|uniref:Uncharacterized protein n=1 Tax=marine sediment metagenome TaxID=412755 RepID=A0A0F9TQ70_9ZZZZ